jgi:Flp pilus assembly protein TadD
LESVTPHISTALKQAEKFIHSGHFAQAEAVCRQIIAFDPRHAKALHFLGFIALRTGRAPLALELLQTSVNIEPKDAMALLDLGSALLVLGRFEQAVDPYQRAVLLRPDLPAGYTGLGVANHESGRAREALAYFQQAVEHGPNSEETHDNLATALLYNNQPAAALAAARKAVELKPTWHQPYSNIAIAACACGDVPQAIEALRQAILIKPDAPVANSNLLYDLHFHPGYDAAAILREHRRWDQVHAAPIQKEIPRHDNDRTPDRRLRIGYVSPDFRDHCQSFFTVPLLSSHDHQELEIFCYADVRRPDAITERIRKYTDVWRSTCGVPDEKVAEMVRADQIDVLVDLTMHMSRGRPLLFARKPAPVQVAWLAYPSTTGLAAMDARLTDPFLDPPGTHDEFYSEQSIRLPDTFWCYDPLTTEPKVNELPAQKPGHVTLGCLSNFVKVNDNMLALWSQVLSKLPHSRLLLWCPQGNHRQRAVEKLGVDAARVDFIERQPRVKFLELFHRVDFCLDTFPYNGHTTSLDGLWMGVPTVSLRGQTAVSRAGFSQLSNLGLTDLVTADRNEFVKIAVELARDLPRLRELRSTLRHRMEKSPLMDAPRFARGVEAAYRGLWRQRCEK